MRTYIYCKYELYLGFLIFDLGKCLYRNPEYFTIGGKWQDFLAWFAQAAIFKMAASTNPGDLIVRAKVLLKQD